MSYIYIIGIDIYIYNMTPLKSFSVHLQILEIGRTGEKLGYPFLELSLPSSSSLSWQSLLLLSESSWVEEEEMQELGMVITEENGGWEDDECEKERAFSSEQP